MNTKQSTASAYVHLRRYVTSTTKLMSYISSTAIICITLSIPNADAKPHYEDETMPMNMASGSETLAPIGYRMMCEDTPTLCAPKIGSTKKMALSDARLDQLRKINLDVNKSIKPMTDMELYGVAERWTLPTWAGDCEDFVLLKRQKLIESGWPEETLLMTVVRDLKGEGHAILTVVTDKGDLVLDNHNNVVKLWFETGYAFIKRQSQDMTTRWVSLRGTDQLPTVASTKTNK